MKLHAYILIIVFFLSASLGTVNAEPPPAQKLPKINGALTDFAETKFGGTEAIDILAGTTFGFELQDIILPIYNKVKQIAAPDFKPLGIGTMQTYNKYLIPESFNDTIIHYSDINENIATTIFCAVIRNRSKYGKNALTISKSGVQKSSNFEYSQEAFENLRKANAVYGLAAVEPNAEGFLDFNLPSMYHPPGTAKCGWHYLSEEDKPVENDVTELASWGGSTGTVDVTNTWETIIKWIKQVINGITKSIFDGYEKFYPSYEAVLTENTRPSNFEQLAHAGDATEKDVDNAADEETKKLAKSRGLAFAYLPEEKSIDPSEHAGKTEYSYNIKSLSLEGNDVFDGKNGGIEHPWLLVNNAKFRTCQMARSVVPDGLSKDKSIGDGSKGDIVLDEKCPEEIPPVVKETCSSTTPPELPASSCKLCSPNMAGWAEAGTVPNNKLPDTFIKLIESVGDKMHVPPASILSAMYHEGAFVATQLSTDIYQGGPFIGADQWTEENVNKWLMCGAPIPNCSIEKNAFDVCHVGNESTPECTKAIVGTGTMPKWFWGNGGDSDPWNAVLEIDPSRTKETISPCNLVDSVAAMAKQLRNWGQTPRTPSTCYEKPMTSATAASSCSNSSWNDDKILQSHVGLWVGSTPWCPDGKTSSPLANNSPNPNYDDMVLGAYHAFSCNP